ncbi:gamma-aminobutyric acid type B receptor subunit 2-like [Mya arenaria]|uniref:gamma-aminobutyric acid type B receptor subunit 2-like n=1 Tax=Mya arenaria TaxID=6604 RepID=UPI0022E338CF|nr:gamma-aminobutyric acid type B receptor subunit 2-like [Mya arenaria]
MMKYFGWSRIATLAYQDEYNVPAYKQGLYGPSYVWILFGTILQTYANGWMKATKDCTLEQIKTAANGHFSLHNLNVGYSNETTISGKTASEEMSFLETLIASTPYKLSSSSAYVTDTAWSLALGINNSLKYLEEKGLSLSNYNYSEDFSQAIIKGIQETSFVGVSVAERETIVAYYDLNDDTLTWVVDEASIWTDGRAPRDSFTYLTFLVPPSYAAAIVINILNTFGCISTLAFLVYNTVYRNNWSIKMSSPYVNNVIIVGCLMMYSEVYLDSMDYMHVTQPGSGGSVCMDSVDKNLILQEIITYCDSEKKMHWLVTLYVYKGILLAFGTFITWETRHVTVPELNDSKYIGACIYNVVVVCVFGVPLAHVLPIEQKTVNFVLESCLLIFCTTICACIIFVPKIKNRNKVQSSFLHVNPSTSNERLPGKQISNITEMPPTTSQTKENTNVATTDDMKSEIKDLRHQLTMESIALAKLRKSLLVETGNLHFYKSHNEYVVFKSGCSVNEDSKATVAEVNINSLC